MATANTPPRTLPEVADLAMENSRSIAVINEKISELTATTAQVASEMADQLAAAHERLVQTVAGLVQEDRARLATLTTGLDNLRADVSNLTASVSALTDAQQQTNERVTRLDDQLSALTDAQRQTNERVTRLDDQLSSLSSQVSNLTASVSALTDAQQQTNERVTRLEDQLSSLSSQVSNLTASISALTDAQQQTNERVTRLEDQLSSLTDAQQQTNERVTRLEDQLSSLSSQVSNLTASISALTDAQQQTNERVTRLEDQLSSLSSQVSNLTASVAALTDAQQQTNERMTDMNDRLSTLSGRVANIAGGRYETEAARLVPRHVRRYLNLVNATITHTSWEPGDVVSAAVNSDDITDAEAKDLNRADLVITGQNDAGNTVHVAGEISITIEPSDITRSASRADILRKATGQIVHATAIGTEATTDAIDAAEHQHVTILTIAAPTEED